MQVAYGGLKGEGASRFVFLRGPGGIFRVLELIRLRAGDRAVKTTRLSPECHPPTCRHRRPCLRTTCIAPV